jgi:hypothetical protein
MNRKRTILIATIALNLICSMSVSAFGQDSKQEQNLSKQDRIKEVVNAGNKSIIEDDWVSAESHFREAVKLQPKQALWRIQLLIALGQQKKWKDAFKEMDIVVRELGAADWVLSIHKKRPDGKVAIINTEIFRDEQKGILRYVKAVKEKKKVDSVSEDIGVKIDEFAKLNNLALIYDISKFKNMPFARGKTIDITSDFIAYYNERDKD